MELRLIFYPSFFYFVFSLAFFFFNFVNLIFVVVFYTKTLRLTLKEEQEPGLKGRVQARGFKHKEASTSPEPGQGVGGLQSPSGVERRGSGRGQEEIEG